MFYRSKVVQTAAEDIHIDDGDRYTFTAAAFEPVMHRVLHPTSVLGTTVNAHVWLAVAIQHVAWGVYGIGTGRRGDRSSLLKGAVDIVVCTTQINRHHHRKILHRALVRNGWKAQRLSWLVDQPNDEHG